MIDNSFRLRYKNAPAAIYLKENSKMTPLHNHGELEILLIEQGASKIRVGSEEYFCGAGDLVFVNPMEVHSVEPMESAPYRQKCICLDLSLISDAKISQSIKDGALRFLRYVQKENDNSESLRKCFRAAFSAISSSKKAELLEVSAYLSLIVARMINADMTEQGGKTDRGDKFCVDVLAYISSRFCEKITSNDAARALSYHHSYFCRRFREGFGTTFSRYLGVFRVTRAVELLEAGNRNISEVAFECGFSDAVYFSKCFKKYVGILPSEYRKKSI